jgi:predicted phosphodiesterase
MSLPKIKFQLASDLHLEQGQFAKNYRNIAVLPDRGCEYLLLAGDIGSVGILYHQDAFRQWLISTCQRYELVFWIGGNNEFKGNSVNYGVGVMRRFAADPRMQEKLIVLENDSYDMMKHGYNISILGCVLWTRIRADQPSTDKQIKDNNKRLHNARFKKSLRRIKQQVEAIRNEDPKRRILVMTHHAPTVRGSSRPELENDTNKTWSAYQTDILGGEGVPGLQSGDVWAFGHAHWSCSFVQDDVRVIANQKGSTGEKSGWGKFPDFEM